MKMTLEEWWINWTTPEMRQDIKHYYSITYELIEAIVEKEGIGVNQSFDLRISSYPISGRVLGFKFEILVYGDVVHERELTPKVMLGPNDLFEKDPLVPIFWSKDRKMFRKYKGKEESGFLNDDGVFIPDEVI
jgi:hypothetical protein